MMKELIYSRDYGDPLADEEFWCCDPEEEAFSAEQALAPTDGQTSPNANFAELFF